MARGRKVDDPMILESGLLLALIPLISPLGWDYTLLSSVLVVMLVLKHFDAFPGPRRVLLVVNFGVFGLSLFDLMGRDLYAGFMALVGADRERPRLRRRRRLDQVPGAGLRMRR